MYFNLNIMNIEKMSSRDKKKERKRKKKEKVNETVTPNKSSWIRSYCFDLFQFWFL